MDFRILIAALSGIMHVEVVSLEDAKELYGEQPSLCLIDEVPPPIELVGRRFHVVEDQPKQITPKNLPYGVPKRTTKGKVAKW